MSYVLLQQFRSLFEGQKYRHRKSNLGDSVASCLPDDLYALGRSAKFVQRVDARQGVVDLRNILHGVRARRGDGTFGEIVPQSEAIEEAGFVVARGPVATVEIGTEVKILANSMIKQIDRVINDLKNQVVEFRSAGGTPVTVGIIGINHADRYISYEGEREWPTGGRGKKHPIQEAPDAEARLRAKAEASFDEFLVLRFKARNEPPYQFEWVNEAATAMDYGAVLARIARKYDSRF